MPQTLTPALQVDDIASAVAWYRKQFQCEVKYQDECCAILGFDQISVTLVAPAHQEHA